MVLMKCEFKTIDGKVTAVFRAESSKEFDSANRQNQQVGAAIARGDTATQRNAERGLTRLLYYGDRPRYTKKELADLRYSEPWSAEKEDAYYAGCDRRDADRVTRGSLSPEMAAAYSANRAAHRAAESEARMKGKSTV